MKKVINVHGLSLGLLNDKLWEKNRSSIPRNCIEDFSYFFIFKNGWEFISKGKHI